MASPFRSATNFVVFAPGQPDPCGQVERDVLGNRVVVPAESIRLDTYAYRIKRQAEYQHEAGPDESQVFLACRCVSPLFMPPGVQIGSICMAVLRNNDRSITVGKASVLEAVQSPWRSVTKALGTKFVVAFIPGGRDEVGMESARIAQALRSV